MKQWVRNIAAPLAVAALAAGCTTVADPVEVTRFVAEESRAELGKGTIFVEAVGDEPGAAQDLLVYQAAVARELTALGYREAARADARQVAQVRVDQALIGTDRSPVTVGAGGSVGSYGSGAGVGVGINLGGRDKERLATRLEVRILDRQSGQGLWEGRAIFEVATRSLLADSAQNASVMAEALFRSFPGSNGETVQVPITQ